MLPVPLVRQKTNYSCGPAALLAVMRYWKACGEEERDLYDPCDTDPKTGTERDGIARVARAHGLHADVRTGVGLSSLETALERGVPPILAIQAWGEDLEDRCDAGHYVVLVGLEDGRAYFMDPSVADGYSWMLISELLDRWHDIEDEECKERMAIFIEGADRERGALPARVTQKTEAVNFDGMPYRNIRLTDVAKLLAGAVKANPIHPDLVEKLVTRLVSGLEVSIMGVDGRAEADRFSKTLRRALSDLVTRLPSAANEGVRGEPLSIEELHRIKALLVPVLSERFSLDEVGGSAEDPPKKYAMDLAKKYGGEIDSEDTSMSGELAVWFPKMWTAWQYVKELGHAFGAVAPKLQKPGASFSLPTGRTLIMVPVRG